MLLMLPFARLALGGASWTDYRNNAARTNGTFAPLYACAKADSVTAFVGGVNGAVYQTTSGGGPVTVNPADRTQSSGFANMPSALAAVRPSVLSPPAPAQPMSAIAFESRRLSLISLSSPLIIRSVYYRGRSERCDGAALRQRVLWMGRGDFWPDYAGGPQFSLSHKICIRLQNPHPHSVLSPRSRDALSLSPL